ALPNQSFEGEVAFVHPHLDAGTRTLKVRFDVKNPGHELRPGMYATVKLDVPAAQLDSITTAVQEDWRDRTAADIAVRAVLAQGGLPVPGGLGPWVETAGRLTFGQRGQVLAVPETAVIDTGSRKFLYREAWPGVYDGIEVQLGSRGGEFYPVVRGLE